MRKYPLEAWQGSRIMRPGRERGGTRVNNFDSFMQGRSRDFVDTPQGCHA